jgi:DNA repair protein RecO (recombination protein O)
VKPQIVTKGIVLSRRDYQEADRILSVLTPDNGKVSLIAKGVRKPKSKLAGGIELFSVSQLTYLPSHNDLKTLVSSRLVQHYGNIVKDIERTMLGYEFMKRLQKILEESAGGEYFELLQHGLAGLDNFEISKEVVEVWFNMQLLQMTGHSPNLRTDSTGAPLESGKTYIFEFDEMTFAPGPEGEPSTDLIKYLRLASVSASPAALAQVKASVDLQGIVLQMTKSMLTYTLRV